MNRKVLSGGKCYSATSWNVPISPCKSSYRPTQILDSVLQLLLLKFPQASDYKKNKLLLQWWIRKGRKHRNMKEMQLIKAQKLVEKIRQNCELKVKVQEQIMFTFHQDSWFLYFTIFWGSEMQSLKHATDYFINKSEISQSEVGLWFLISIK